MNDEDLQKLQAKFNAWWVAEGDARAAKIRMFCGLPNIKQCRELCEDAVIKCFDAMTNNIDIGGA